MSTILCLLCVLTTERLVSLWRFKVYNRKWRFFSVHMFFDGGVSYSG